MGKRTAARRRYNQALGRLKRVKMAKIDEKRQSEVLKNLKRAMTIHPKSKNIQHQQLSEIIKEDT